MARTFPPPTKFAPGPQLQPKPAAAGKRPGAAPPPTKFGPGSGGQAKRAPASTPPRHAPPPPARAGYAAAALQPVARKSVPRSLQAAALVRHNFSTDTKHEVLVGKGEHRRHIIPNHLMKQALQAWKDTHSGTPLSELQSLLDDMNDYVPNLHPGDGVQNSAMGMISTWAPKKLDNVDVGTATSADVKAAFAKPTGFFQAHQTTMLAPVVSAFGTDPTLSSSSTSAVAFGKNIVDSTDFDWPGGTTPEFEAWNESYNAFLSLKKNAAAYDKAGMLKVCAAFMKLKAPSGKHS